VALTRMRKNKFASLLAVLFLVTACAPRPPQWTTYTPQGGSESGVLSIAVGPDGTMWFGTSINGVSHFDGKTWVTYKDGPISSLIFSIAMAPDKAIWVGTPGGASRFDGKTWISYPFSSEHIEPPGSVASIAVAPDGSLWFGAHYVEVPDDKPYRISGGLSHFDGQSWTTYLPDETINSIAVAPDGSLWFGSGGNGVHRFDGKTWTTFSRSDGLASEYVKSIAIAPDRSLWFGTWSSGVSRFDGKTWTRYTTDDGLASDNANCVAVAPNGDVWVGTDEGVSCFNGSTWTTTLGRKSAYHSMSSLKRETPVFTAGWPVFEW
jgi:ligand-binding sensor domain-containing protein